MTDKKIEISEIGPPYYYGRQNMRARVEPKWPYVDVFDRNPKNDVFMIPI